MIKLILFYPCTLQWIKTKSTDSQCVYRILTNIVISQNVANMSSTFRKYVMFNKWITQHLFLVDSPIWIYKWETLFCCCSVVWIRGCLKQHYWQFVREGSKCPNRADLFLVLAYVLIQRLGLHVPPSLPIVWIFFLIITQSRFDMKNKSNQWLGKIEYLLFLHWKAKETTDLIYT